MTDFPFITDLLGKIFSIVQEILDQLKSLRQEACKVDPDGVYDNNYVKTLLHIQDKYLKKLRDNGYLAYSREGDKYWYRGRDIITLLDKFYYPAFATRKELP